MWATWDRRRLLAGCMATIGLALAGATVASIYVDLPRLFRAGPWLVALALLLGLWELVTAKLDLLPRPSSRHRSR